MPDTSLHDAVKFFLMEPLPGRKNRAITEEAEPPAG